LWLVGSGVGGEVGEAEEIGRGEKEKKGKAEW